MSISFKERAIAKAIAYAKDAETERQLREQLLIFADKIENGESIDSELSNNISAILTNSDKCRTPEEAESMYWDIIYDMENDNSKWTQVISSFGPGTPEALIAQDMIELDESVKVSETSFNKYSNDLDILETDVANLEKAVDMVDKDGSIYDKLTGDISSDQKLIDARAEALVEAAKLRHPLSYVVGTMKESIADIIETRASVKALQGDYRTSLERVAQAIVSKPAAIYTSAKAGTLQVLSSIAERTASIYKAGCSKFESLMEDMKQKFASLKEKAAFALDVVVNAVSFGYFAENNIRAIEAASEPGKSYVDKMKDMIPVNPGVIGREALERLNDFGTERNALPKSLSGIYGFVLAEEAIREDEKAMKKNANLEKQGKGLDYWQNVKEASFGKNKSLAEIDWELAEQIYANDFKSDKIIADTFDKIKASLSGPVATMVAAKDKVVDFVKEIPSNFKNFVGNLVTEAKIIALTAKTNAQEMVASILTSASKVADRAEKMVNSQVITLENFDKQMSERISAIQNQIQELRSPVVVERAEYKTSPQILENITVLKAATPTAAVTRLLDSTLAQEAKRQARFDAKENVVATVKEIEGTIKNYTVSAALEDQLNVATIQKAVTTDELKGAVKRAEIAGKIKDAFAKGAGVMMGKADATWEKVEQTSLNSIKEANVSEKDDYTDRE